MKITTKSIPSPQKTPLKIADGKKLAQLSNGRIDTTKLKEQLTQHLGKNADTYWNSFKKLITCKIEPKDFEGIVRKFLGQEHVELHNALIYAILINSKSNEPPPTLSPSAAIIASTATKFTTTTITSSTSSSLQLQQQLQQDQQSDEQISSQSTRKRIREGEYEDETPVEIRKIEPKRQKIKALVMSLPREERERLKRIGKDQQNEQNKSNSSFSENSKYNDIEDRPIISRQQNETVRVPTCREIKGLPDHGVLYDRLMNIVKANELQGLSEECVSFMNYALESHLKNLIGNCIQKVRPSESSLGRNGGGGFLGNGGGSFYRNRYMARQARQEKNTITSRDLSFSFDLSPHILVEPMMTRERLTSVVLNDDEDYFDEDEGDKDDDVDEMDYEYDNDNNDGNEHSELSL